MYHAIRQHWMTVRAVVETTDAYIFDFVAQAQKRSIYTPADMMLLSHDEYNVKWHQFCNNYFQRNT